MTKQTLQRKGVLAVAIVLMILLVFASIFVAAMTGKGTYAEAADYSYNANVNTVTWDDNDGLTVCFTCTSNGLNMQNWTLFLFSSSSFSYVGYDSSTHKLTNSGNMGQDSASHYFNSSVKTNTGTITITFPKTATDLKNTSRNLGQIWGSDDWRVVIGPHHNWQGNDSYNCDYYVGQANTITAASTVTHKHNGITYTAWESSNSLPTSAGSYYLTSDVTLSGAWTVPSGTFNLCLNGYGIKSSSGRVITINGATLNLYDCGTATHYYNVNGDGQAYDVNKSSGTKSFAGGYITGGNGGNGLAQTSLYWGEGGGILVWSGTLNMYGGTILGNYAGHGGGVEVVNATMNMYGGNIIFNRCGEGGSGVNLRSQAGNTATLNMYGGNIDYNKGTAIDQSYCNGTRYLNVYGGSISHNVGSGIWCSNTAIDGDPVIEDNRGLGVSGHTALSLRGTPTIRNNDSGDMRVDNVINITGVLNVATPIRVYKNSVATGVFTSGFSTYNSGDPTDYFMAYNENLDVGYNDAETELKLFNEIKTEIVVEGSAPQAVVSNLDETLAMSLLDGDEITQFNNGQSVKIYLEVNADEGNTISSSDKTAAENVLASGLTVGQYFDLSLWKKIGTNAAQQITDANGLLDVAIPLPELPEVADNYVRQYYIVRVHDGVAKVLNATVNGSTINFKTDKFSTYLFAYNDTDAYLEFTLSVVDGNVRYVDSTNVGDQVVVNYKVTHNGGINSLLLIPEFDSDVFSIASVSINETALGASTMTQGDGTMKILVENTGDKYNALDGENEFFLTVTYELKAATAGVYDFGLVLDEEGDNNSSVAYYIEDGQQKGEQTFVPITVITTSVELIEMEEAHIEIGYNREDDNNETVQYLFTYAGGGVETTKVDEIVNTIGANDFIAQYTYDGTATVNIVWYGQDYNGDVDRENVLSEAPSIPGAYYVGISAPRHENYYAVAEVLRFVEIERATIEITVDNKTSQYLAATEELTAIASGVPGCLSYTLECAATSTSNVGDYAITIVPVWSISNPDTYYNCIFSNGYYTITPITLYLKADDQTYPYTGDVVAPTKSYHLFSDEECTVGYAENGQYAFVINDNYVSVVTEQSYSEIGEYVDKILISYSVNPTNYTIQTVPGTLRINGADYEYYHAFFETHNYTYNGELQAILTQIPETLPNWITISSISAPNGDSTTAAPLMRKQAYSYPITVVLQLPDDTYYIDSNEQNSDTVTLLYEAVISPYEIEFEAIGGSHVFGNQPTKNYAEPTIGTEYRIKPGQGYEIFGEDTFTVQFNVTHSVTGDPVTLSASTNVATYNVAFSASNPNYYVATIDSATYTVSQAQATASLDLTGFSNNEVYYNREWDYEAIISVNTLGISDLGLNLNNGYSIVITDSDSNELEGKPVNHGSYTITLIVDDTNNYLGCEISQTITIKQVPLAAPTLEYDVDTVTITGVSMDNPVGEDGLALIPYDQETALVFSYVINGESGNEYTATATSAGYTYTVSVNNDNYLPYQGTTAASYSVTYADDPTSHDNNGEPTDMPDPLTVYAFSGESITVSDSIPKLTGLGFSFLNWTTDGTDSYAPGSMYTVNGNTVLKTFWSEGALTVTFRFFDSLVVYESNFARHAEITYPKSALKALNQFAGYSSVQADDYKIVRWKYDDETVYTMTGEEGNTVSLGVTAEVEDMVFVADLAFAIDYYFVDSESVDYSGVTVDEYFVEYGATIDYKTINTTYNWFKADYWYLNEARTNADIPSTMPAHKVNLYGGYKFDIGAGDVNASGTVTADDITLYRKWIVGGYSMTVVEVGNEWATVTDNGFDPTAVYFIKRVADINVDESKDIRDVSITRMALVGGYTWDIVTGETVTGGEIVRSQTVNTYEALAAWFENGHDRISLSGDVTSASADFVISTNKNIYIDLCGNTLTVRSINFSTSGNGATITVKNGTIVTTSGITITAPNGNVIIRNVAAYDNGNEINLQAASNSLHFFGNVSFRNGTVLSSTAADVKVASGTHIVIEAAANVTVKKIVAATVTNNTFVADNTAELSVTNESTATDPIVITGQCVETNSSVTNKVFTKVSTFEELVLAEGKAVYLDADIDAGNYYIAYSQDTTIDLNGHTITFDRWGFEINNGATLTIGGEGTVTALKACFDMLDASTLYINGGAYTSTGDCAIYCRQGSSLTIEDATITAQEACVVAYENSQVLIEDGEFTSVDNFVIGTNGTTGKGGNVITINGGVFNGGIQTNGYIACGVYVANNDTVVISGGTFNITDGIGILARSGNTTIGEDVVFNIEGNSLSGGVGDKSLNITSGSAIVKDLTNPVYPGGTPTVTNNNGSAIVVLQ